MLKRYLRKKFIEIYRIPRRLKQRTLRVAPLVMDRQSLLLSLRKAFYSLTPFLNQEPRYLAMQRSWYERAAGKAKVKMGVITLDDVVGSWNQHNEWDDYENYMFMWAIDNFFENALDFGCGPGRSILKWGYLFEKIDGVDISQKNLENAHILLGKNKKTNLYLSKGNDLGRSPIEYYDFIFSSICLQHIASHQVRTQILSNMFKSLKLGGRVSLQMGFGATKDAPQGGWQEPRTVDYYDNFFNALSTNGRCDTRVENAQFLELDLKNIGFSEFQYWIRPSGPGDITHENWIFFSAIKPDLQTASAKNVG